MPGLCQNDPLFDASSDASTVLLEQGMADWIRFSLLAAVLITAAIWDVRTSRAPNWLTLGGVVAGLTLAAGIGIVRMIQGENTSALSQEMTAAIVGLLAGFIPMAIIFFSGAMGGADVKTMAAAGAISASWPIAFETFVNAFVIAALIGIILMIRHRLLWRTIMRLWGAIMMAMSRTRPQFSQDSPKVPFLLAVAIGGILAAGRHLLGWPIPWGLNVS